MVSLETTATAVTERADVVLPVTLMEQRAGSFLNWEGRDRSFEAAVPRPTELTDLRVLAALADALGADLGFRTPAQAKAELVELGPWDGARRIAPSTDPRSLGEPGRRVRPSSPPGGSAWTRARRWPASPTCWPPPGRPCSGSGRRPRPTAGITDRATIGTERGSLTLPVEIVDDLPVGVVWAPTRAPRHGVAEHLAAVAGDLVTLAAGGRGQRRRVVNLLPLDLTIFGAAPWWVVLIKALFAFVVLLVMTLFTIWYERRVVALMQHRKGPNMNGPFGLLQSLADGMKLMFKEDFTPNAADRVVFMLAPFVMAIPAITAFAVIPMAGQVQVPFTDIVTPLQVTDLPVSVLFIVAVASVGVYGIVLAGWSSGSTYSLLGALRSSAQVISYEVAMGLALVAVFLYAHSLSTSEIVAAQAQVNHITARRSEHPAAELVRRHAAAVVLHLPDLDGRRDQPGAVRPARGRG